MKTVVKLLVVLGFASALAGCVVAPGPYGRPRAYVVAPAPVVVVHPHYRRW
jgi:predicted small lipoprotein YifL